jgi:hypothetical protein
VLSPDEAFDEEHNMDDRTRPKARSPGPWLGPGWRCQRPGGCHNQRCPRCRRWALLRRWIGYSDERFTGAVLRKVNALPVELLTVRFGTDDLFRTRLKVFVGKSNDALRYQQMDWTHYRSVEDQGGLLNGHWAAWTITPAGFRTIEDVFAKVAEVVWLETAGTDQVDATPFDCAFSCWSYVAKFSHSTRHLPEPGTVYHQQAWKRGYRAWFLKAVGGEGEST